MDALDQLDRDLETLADLKRLQRFWEASKLMGLGSIMKLDFCVTLAPEISAKSPPGLKLVDLQLFLIRPSGWFLLTQ